MRINVEAKKNKWKYRDMKKAVLPIMIRSTAFLKRIY